MSIAGWVAIGGLGLTTLSLLVTIIVLSVKLGRMFGGQEQVVTQMVSLIGKVSDDIDALWKHQRMQDDRCGDQCRRMAVAVERLTATGEKVDRIFQHIVNVGIESSGAVK